MIRNLRQYLTTPIPGALANTLQNQKALWSNVVFFPIPAPEDINIFKNETNALNNSSGGAKRLCL